MRSADAVPHSSPQHSCSVIGKMQMAHKAMVQAMIDDLQLSGAPPLAMQPLKAVLVQAFERGYSYFNVSSHSLPLSYADPGQHRHSYCLRRCQTFSGRRQTRHLPRTPTL